MLIHRKKVLVVKLAHKAENHNNNSTAILQESKCHYSQGKPNGKIRLLMGSRKINSLIADDWQGNFFPVNLKASKHTLVRR